MLVLILTENMTSRHRKILRNELIHESLLTKKIFVSLSKLN